MYQQVNEHTFHIALSFLEKSRADDISTLDDELLAQIKKRNTTITGYSSLISVSVAGVGKIKLVYQVHQALVERLGLTTLEQYTVKKVVSKGENARIAKQIKDKTRKEESRQLKELRDIARSMTSDDTTDYDLYL